VDIQSHRSRPNRKQNKRTEIVLEESESAIPVIGHTLIAIIPEIDRISEKNQKEKKLIEKNK